jgi:hypothetical protein
LLSVAVRAGKLEVESRPPPAIAAQLRSRKQIDVEITDASDRYWRLQGIAPQQQPVRPIGGGAVILPGGVRIRIGGAARPAPAPAPAPKVNVHPVGADHSAAVDFTASAHGRGRPSDEPRLARVMMMHGTFHLRGRWLRDEKTYQIDFRSHADRTNVTLQVRELARGRRAVVLSMEAADLAQIRRERPTEVRTYLEPMLIEICGGRNPLHPQAGDVYRAFESIPADSAATERVKRIVDTFDALEPSIREAASAQWNQLGRAEVLAAARLDRTELSAEQSLRLDAFIARHSTVTDIAAARRDPLFLIDCLEDEDRAVRAAALIRLRQTTHQPIDFDIDAPREQRAAAAAALALQFLALPPSRTGEAVRQ